jgi:integrase
MILRTHVLPVLGYLPVEQISRSDVEAWVSSIEARVAGNTLRNLHGVLSSVLEGATRETPPLRLDNPAKGVRIRRGLATSEEMCFLSHREWALLHRCLERTSRLERPVDATLGQDLALLLVGSGLRYSEATALQGKHLDLLAPVCTVRIVQAWKRQPGGSYLLEEPKTRRSQRTVTVSDEVRDVLITRSAGKTPDELVFTTVSGGQLKNARFSNYYWRPAVASGRGVSPATRGSRAGLTSTTAGARRPRSSRCSRKCQHRRCASTLSDSRPDVVHGRCRTRQTTMRRRDR